MIGPISVILEFARFRPLYISELKNQPPNRVCYKIKHRYPKITGKRAVEFFENALDEYMQIPLREFPLGEVWMNPD